MGTHKEGDLPVDPAASPPVSGGLGWRQRGDSQCIRADQHEREVALDAQHKICNCFMLVSTAAMEQREHALRRSVLS